MGRWLQQRLKTTALTAAALVAAAASVRAQSPDPQTLRRIIDQKNAEAALATWGDRPATMPAVPGAPNGAANGAAGSGPGGSSGGGQGSGAGGAGGGQGVPADAAGPSRTRRDADVTGGASAAQAAADLHADTQNGVARAIGPAAASRGLTAAQPIADVSAAAVTFSNGLLSVHADNSSLREILDQISKSTGMVVVGALADDRVFGSYGPSRPDAILSELLKGTHTNVLMIEDRSCTVRQLVLTDRP